MVIFPVVAALVSGVFSAMLLRRFAKRHGMPQLAWGIALAMYATASLTVAVGVAQGWDATIYRVFWLFGAVLNVPFLALGSIALTGNRALTALATLVVAAITLFAFGVVVTAKASPDAFLRQNAVKGVDCPSSPVEPREARLDIPRGKCVWQPNSTVGKLGSLFSIPAYLLVVAIAAWTSRPRRGRAIDRNRARGNWMITGGATIVAIGGSAIARLGRGAPFSIALALGVVIMFIGFVWSSRPAPAPESAEAA